MAKEKQIPALMSRPHNYCPGCGHGILNRIIAEVLEETGLDKNNIASIGVGCSSNINWFYPGDKLQCAHGRAPAVAKGVKHARPDVFVFTYQGDGDAYCIGFSEIMNAAYRNEPITAIVVNNQNFGMTGGQMSWTTLEDQVTTTSVRGRNVQKTGQPIKVPEMMAYSFECAYIARGSMHSAKEINRTKKYLQKAVEAQMSGAGFSLIEVLSPCPTNWHCTPVKALDYMKEQVLSYYELGEFKSWEA
ncbi:MAG: 2-oxoglutarate oxidoreductase [Anaerolineales bacterium]|nr:2-oxoglutarate oxidoreductase [Anaerolineales bacterium]